MHQKCTPDHQINKNRCILNLSITLILAIPDRMRIIQALPTAGHQIIILPLKRIMSRLIVRQHELTAKVILLRPDRIIHILLQVDHLKAIHLLQDLLVVSHIHLLQDQPVVQNQLVQEVGEEGDKSC